MNAKGFIDKILDVLFPPRCPWCNTVLGKRHDCAAQHQMEALRLPVRPLPAPKLDSPWLLRDVWACYSYEEPVRGAILRMKFESERNLAVPMGGQLAEVYAESGVAAHTDVIVPVPMSPKSQKRRGYNQSALVAWELSGRVAVTCLSGALQKTRETTPQSELGRTERLVNVAGAYQADETQLKGKRVLLVDDIFTTGSTLNECAKAVLDAGAAECRALCLAAARVDMKLD